MFERFSDHARRAIVLAQEEARDLHHDHIGTEHLLLALTREEDTTAGRALAEAGIDLVAARRRVAEIVGRGDREAGSPGHIPFTPRSKRVLELSLREAQRLDDSFIGAEHLLLGMITEGGGVGAQVLVELGAELAALRGRTLELHAAQPPDPGPEPSGHPSGQHITRHEARTRFGSARTGQEPRPTLEARLAGIEQRLARIEKHLNLSAEEGKEKPASPGDPGEASGPGEADEPGADPSGAGPSN